jgi:hypothetical protein
MTRKTGRTMVRMSTNSGMPLLAGKLKRINQWLCGCPI